MFQKGRETVNHFLLECELNNKIRDLDHLKMKKDNAQIWFEKRSSGNLNLAKKMLA